MKIAFYAPLKPPSHPRPSGDRRLARHFIAALKLAGFTVEVASALRAWEGDGEAHRQADIEAQGRREAARLLAEYRARPASMRPRAWFTYHLYHKAPDWLGPAVSAALGIPYIAAEASIAAKQKHGAWSRGYAESAAAAAAARLIFNLNSNDLPGLRAHGVDESRIVQLKPFAEIPPAAAPVPPSPADKTQLRRSLGARFGIDPAARWLLCVAMLRGGDKRESYRILAAAAGRLRRSDWRLILIGDGAAAADIEAEFARQLPESPELPAPAAARGPTATVAGRVHFLGRLPGDAVFDWLRAGDLFVWPAYNEAFGMAMLEAMACGLPVVAGRWRDGGGGIADIVEHAVTGVLVERPDQDGGAAFAAAVEELLGSPAMCAAFATAAADKFNRLHRLEHAAAAIRKALLPLLDSVD